MCKSTWDRRGAAALVVLVASITLWSASLAHADTPPQVSPTPAPSPTIVSQLTNKDTMYSNTYRLSDGSYQAQIFSPPIRFKDASGAWQNFDTSLVAAGLAGVYHASRHAGGHHHRQPPALGSPPAQL